MPTPEARGWFPNAGPGKGFRKLRPTILKLLNCPTKGAAPEATFRTTLLELYVMLKCSLELIGHVPLVLPSQLAKVPVLELKFMIVNDWPTEGVKPLIKVVVRAPFKLAVVGLN